MLLELSKKCYISYVKTSCGAVGHEILFKKANILLYKLEILEKKQYLKKIVLWRNISLCGIAHDEAIFVSFEFVLTKCRGCQHQVWWGPFRWELLSYKLRETYFSNCLHRKIVKLTLIMRIFQETLVSVDHKGSWEYISSSRARSNFKLFSGNSSCTGLG